MTLRIWLVALLITVITAGSAAAQQPQRRDSRWNGFLIGAVVGVVAGVAVGMGIKTYCENEARNCDTAVPILGGVGSAVGGFVGAAVDDAIGKSVGAGRLRPRPGIRFTIRF